MNKLAEFIVEPGYYREVLFFYTYVHRYTVTIKHWEANQEYSRDSYRRVDRSANSIEEAFELAKNDLYNILKQDASPKPK